MTTHHPKFSTIKKTVASLVAAGLLIQTIFLPAAFLLTPRRAEASVPIHCTLLVDFNCQKEQILDPIVRGLAQTLIKGLIRSTINWLQGNGGFVQNLERELRHAVDVRGAEFINGLLGTNLCGNLGITIPRTLRFPRQFIQDRYECTVTGIIDNINDINQFYDDFTHGGFPRLIEIAFIPQNNKYGQFIKDLDGKIVSELDRKETVLNEYQAGRGFLGFQVTETVCDGEGLCHTESVTRTPGELVAATLNKATNIEFDFLVAADEFDELFKALGSFFLNKLFTASSGGGKGLTDPSLGSFSDEITDAEISLDDQADNLISDAQGFIAKIDNQISDWTAVTVTDMSPFISQLQGRRDQLLNIIGTLTQYKNTKLNDPNISSKELGEIALDIQLGIPDELKQIDSAINSVTAEGEEAIQEALEALLPPD